MMIKIFLPLLVVLSFSNAQALVKVQFFGMQTMLNVIGQDRFGNRDSDPIDLFNMMNAPIQHSFLGPGKSIVTPDKKFNFVCGVQGNENKCSAIIQASSATIANPFNNTLTYEVHGTEAFALAEKFFLSENQSLHFVSADQQLSIDATPEHFRLHFQGNGSK